MAHGAAGHGGGRALGSCDRRARPAHARPGRSAAGSAVHDRFNRHARRRRRARPLVIRLGRGGPTPHGRCGKCRPPFGRARDHDPIRIAHRGRSYRSIGRRLTVRSTAQVERALVAKASIHSTRASGPPALGGWQRSDAVPAPPMPQLGHLRKGAGGFREFASCRRPNSKDATMRRTEKSEDWSFTSEASGRPRPAASLLPRQCLARRDKTGTSARGVRPGQGVRCDFVPSHAQPSVNRWLLGPGGAAKALRRDRNPSFVTPHGTSGTGRAGPGLSRLSRIHTSTAE